MAGPGSMSGSHRAPAGQGAARMLPKPQGGKAATMVLFENILLLVLVAILVLQFSRRLVVPYPAVLATAGVAVAALPSAPEIAIDPQLALALFIAPALLDSAFDMPPRDIRRFWMPLVALAVVAVVLTTAAVAWAGVAWAGLPLAAAVALGALVAPPDAAAAAAMLGRLALPRSTVTVLKAESLFNDAASLLLFTAALEVVMAPEQSLSAVLLRLAPAAPGGILLGIGLGWIHIRLSARLAGTLGGTLFEFVATFGTWIIAERLHLSAILAVVAFGMTVAQLIPGRRSAGDRVHSYSVWEVAVFVLNVLAFFLIGLQAREIARRMPPERFWETLGVALGVLAVVILVRVAWVLLYNRAINSTARLRALSGAPSLRQGVVVSWCGMRGLVTLAAALALPADFPQRDLILMSALVVVLGTLVLQGLTLRPLIRWLGFAPDESFGREITQARTALIDAALAGLEGERDEAAEELRGEYRAAREVAAAGRHPRAVRRIDALRREGIAAKRRRLAELRNAGTIGEDVFQALEQELDWAELAASPPGRFEIVEG